jgi:hypothetical protein
MQNISVCTKSVFFGFAQQLLRFICVIKSNRATQTNIILRSCSLSLAFLVPLFLISFLRWFFVEDTIGLRGFFGDGRLHLAFLTALWALCILKQKKTNSKQNRKKNNLIGSRNKQTNKGLVKVAGTSF